MTRIRTEGNGRGNNRQHRVTVTNCCETIMSVNSPISVVVVVRVDWLVTWCNVTRLRNYYCVLQSSTKTTTQLQWHNHSTATGKWCIKDKEVLPICCEMCQKQIGSAASTKSPPIRTSWSLVRKPSFTELTISQGRTIITNNMYEMMSSGRTHIRKRE